MCRDVKAVRAIVIQIDTVSSQECGVMRFLHTMEVKATPSEMPIDYWYWNVSDTEEGVVFRDVCSGPHCSNACPEEIILETESAAEDWSGAAKIVIAVIVLAIVVFSLLLKVNNVTISNISLWSLIKTVQRLEMPN